MKTRSNVLLLAFALLTTSACTGVNSQIITSSPGPRGPEVHGVFAGTTPCSPSARPLPQIPADTDCEQMIWNLVLYQDPSTGTPTTYSLKGAYGLPEQNTNDLDGGGTPISMEGKWTTAQGTRTDPDAVIYQINPDDPQRTVSFLKISADLLHVLNSEKALLVGNGAWSYTLNRMDNQKPLDESPGSPPEPPTRPPLPPMPEGASVLGVFDGRTPCHAVALEFTKVAPFPGCMKIKWRLTLYQDSATGAPSTYLFMGTSTYREGSWKIVHGREGDPNAVVYQLQLDDAQEPVSFLKVDENHLFLLDREMNLLVGNALFSYTLSRTDQGTQ
ncbi:MAG: hypothetical protein EHM40_06150 [Chloroflexi bacterium]|nr:MAG: hypothetical protein EHM40_06150 [Chloroflexota bacterium]